MSDNKKISLFHAVIEPPWVKYPGYPPYDTFWRQSGENWLAHIWAPYWDSLNLIEKENYLDYWNAPDVWRRCSVHISSDFKLLLESIDDE